MRLKLLALLILVVSSFAVAQETAQQRRIVRPIDNASAVRLQGTLAPRARADLDRGPVSADKPMQHMTLVFSRTAEQQAALDQLLAEQQDRNSPNYHKWLTPEQFADRFGLAQPDVDLVAAWLTAEGFTVDEIARSRTWIAFSGIAAQVENAFHAPIHNYLVDGVMHFAPSTEAAVPSAPADVVAAITGLHDFHPHAQSHMRHASPRLTSSISGNHFIVPGDFGTIYNLPDYVDGAFQSGLDGSGQTIGIVGQTRLNTTGTGPFTDIDTFRSLSNLPALVAAPATPNLTSALAMGATDPGFVTGDIEEANLDIEWAGAVVPNANIVFVYSPDALLTSLPYIVNQNLAVVISVSYGECETSAPSGDITAVETSLQQANAQGQTVVVAAGDNGATDCDTTSPSTHGLAVDYPASSVYVTAMGGTEFTGDSQAAPYNGAAPPDQYWNGSSNLNDTSATAFSYIPETTWNDTSGTTISATGGGASAKFSKPTWQTGVGVPQDGHRDVPDLALSSSPAHDGYIICSQGACQTGYRRNSDQTFTVIGGTSAAVPTFAGVAALANQKLGARQGNLNPKIYTLATSSSSWAFNDITTGNNLVACTSGTGCPTGGGSIGYSAGTGYDLVTGWGSIDATGLLDALAGTPNPHFLILPASRNVTLSPANSGTVALSVTPKEGFSGIVALTCSVSSLQGGSCSYDNANVTTPGSANLTIQPGSAQSGQTGTVTLQGTSGSNTDSVVITVAIATPDFQVSSVNQTETVTAGSTTTDTITVASLQGFTGSVSFSCSATAGLTCSLNPNPVTAGSSAVTSTLTVTASSSASTGSITITATSGAITHTVPIPVMVNAAAADFTLTVANSAVSVPGGQMITDNLTVAAVGGFNSDVALTCSVASSLGSTACTISPTTVTGGSGTALVTINGAVLTQDRGGPLPFRHRGIGAYATLVFALGMVFTVNPKRGRHSKRALRNTIFSLFLMCAMLGALSCGGGSGSTSTGPTPLNGNVTITGISGTLTHTATINVTVH